MPTLRPLGHAGNLFGGGNGNQAPSSLLFHFPIMMGTIFLYHILLPSVLAYPHHRPKGRRANIIVSGLYTGNQYKPFVYTSILSQVLTHCATMFLLNTTFLYPSLYGTISNNMCSCCRPSRSYRHIIRFFLLDHIRKCKEIHISSLIYIYHSWIPLVFLMCLKNVYHPAQKTFFLNPAYFVTVKMTILSHF